VAAGRAGYGWQKNEDRFFRELLGGISLFWGDTDERDLERVHELIRNTMRIPYSGIGKPEPLRHALAGYWLHRITGEHRLVYRVEKGDLVVAQLRNHCGS
jgi:toxin YoeB